MSPRSQADLTQTDGTGSSDAEYITTWLQQNGYSARFFRIEARDFGSYPRRHRIYWVAFLNGMDSSLNAGQVLLDNVAAHIATIPPSVGTQQLRLYLADARMVTCADKVAKLDAPEKSYKYKEVRGC